MAGTTIIDYDEMNDIISLFKTREEKILHLLKTTQAKVQDLHNHKWVGKAADKFFIEMEQTVLPALARLAYALGLGAVAAKEIVDTIRQADEKTQSKFNNLFR